MKFVECPNCGYDKWDGESTHDFGGRASAGVKCWGPKTHQRVRTVVAEKPISARETVKSAREIIRAETGNQPNEIVVPMQTVEHLNPGLAKRLKEAGPDVPVPTQEPKTSKRAAKYSNALAMLESSLGLKRAVDLPKPDRSSSPKAVREGRSKSSSRLADRARPARRRKS